MRRLGVFLASLSLGACHHAALPANPTGPAPTGADDPLTAACPFAAGGDPSRVVMALISENRLELVHADKSRTTAFSSAEDPKMRIDQEVLAHGDFVAARFHTSLGQGHTDTREEAVLVRRSTGELLWHDSWIAPRPATLFLSDEGRVTIDRGDGDGAVVDSSGATRMLASLQPITEATPEGSVLARDVTGGALIWLRDDVTRIESPAYPINETQVHWYAGRLVYLTADPTLPAATAHLVSERPGDVKKVSVAQAMPDSNLSLTGHFAAVARIGLGLGLSPVVRVDLDAMSAETLTFTLPPGARTFNYVSPELAPDGAIELPLRDDYQGWLGRTTDGSTWTQIGKSVAGVLAIGAPTRDGTFLVTAGNDRYIQETWAPAVPGHTPDISGNSAQVVRPAEGVVDTVDYAQLALVTADQIAQGGACLFFRTATSSVGVFDVASGAFSDFGGAPAAALTWAPSR
jgi:hypothetical protein